MFSRGRSLHQPWRWRSQGSSIARGMVAGMGGTKERPGCGNIADMSDELTAGVEGGAHATPVKLSMTRKRKREDVEWKATLNEWGRATGDGNGSDDDRFGLFDHALPSQNEVIADAEEEGDRGTSFTHVSLVGAPAGERYCFPGVGQPPDFLQRKGSCKGDPEAQNKRCHCWCETSPEGAARRCRHKPRHRHTCSKCRTLVCTGSCWIAHRQMCHLCSTHSSGDQCDPE